MVANFLSARWLRPTLALLALAGVAMLGGCGGGSGAPNNPFAPVPPTPTAVSILPNVATAYSNIPTVLNVSGGVPPYFIVSSDSSVLPVAQAASAGTIVLLPSNVGQDTPVTITATDSIGQVAQAAITVKASPIFNTLTVTPNDTSCGTNAVCSGQTATAAVTVTAPGGGGIPNRQVKFDVVTGAFSIESSDPAHPLVSTLTVVSDVNGVAQVILQAAPGVVTQPALIRATELTSGNQQTTQFTIVQTTDGSPVLSVVPSTITFTGPDTQTCTTNFRADVFIFGGKPPYQATITPNFPIVAFLSGVPVTTEGGSFAVITNGNCTDSTGVLIVITDSQGLQTTATLINQLGTTPVPPPTPPTPLVIVPASQSGVCNGTSWPFAITGGTPHYNVSAGSLGSPSAVAPNGLFTVTDTGSAGTPLPAGTVIGIVGVDSGSPQQSASASIKCL